MDESTLVDGIGDVLNAITGQGSRQSGGQPQRPSIAGTVGSALGASPSLMQGISAGARLLGGAIGGGFGSVISAIFG